MEFVEAVDGEVGSGEENFWVGFAVRHIFGGDDGSEKFRETDGAEREVDVLLVPKARLLECKLCFVAGASSAPARGALSVAAEPATSSPLASVAGCR